MLYLQYPLGTVKPVCHQSDGGKGYALSFSKNKTKKSFRINEGVGVGGVNKKQNCPFSYIVIILLWLLFFFLICLKTCTPNLDCIRIIGVVEVRDSGPRLPTFKTPSLAIHYL